MEKNFEQERYRVQAKRKDTNEPWSEWTAVDNYDDAVKHSNRAEELGYLSRIIEGEAHNG